MSAMGNCYSLLPFISPSLGTFFGFSTETAGDSHWQLPHSAAPSQTHFFRHCAQDSLSVPRILSHSKAAQLRLEGHQLLPHEGLDCLYIKRHPKVPLCCALRWPPALLWTHWLWVVWTTFLGLLKLSLMPSGWGTQWGDHHDDCPEPENYQDESGRHLTF